MNQALSQLGFKEPLKNSSPHGIGHFEEAAITVHTDATHSSGYEEIAAISVTGYPAD